MNSSVINSDTCEVTEKVLTFEDLEVGEEFKTSNDLDIVYKKVKLWGYHNNNGKSCHCLAVASNSVFPIDPSTKVLRV